MADPLPPPPSGGAGGSTQPVPFSQTQAGLAFVNQQQLGLLEIQRQNEENLARQQQRNTLEIQAREQTFIAREAERQRAEQAKIRREELARQRQESLNQLQLDREQTFADLMKSGDQVRAVLFASGYGPENQLFDVRARQLGTTLAALKGARELETTTEAALSRVLGRTVDIGKYGASGLGAAVQSARSFVQGGADIQKLLVSAFGVGSTNQGAFYGARGTSRRRFVSSGEAPGISAERYTELVSQVTPRGVL